MIDSSAGVLSKSDQHHLHQAALDVPDETGMRLDSATDNDVIRFRCVLVKVYGKAFIGFADDDGLHAGSDRTLAV